MFRRAAAVPLQVLVSARATPAATTAISAHASRAQCRSAATPLLAPVAGGVLARCFHVSAPAESAVLVATGLGIAAVAVGASYLIRAVDTKNAVNRLTNPDGTAGAAPAAAGGGSDKDKAKPAAAASTGGMFSAQAMARRFYKGGFEDRMTRREAALILGVRESADPSRVRDRHRKLLLLNHPDAGGSGYIASKINEAKDVLIKGTQQKA